MAASANANVKFCEDKNPAFKVEKHQLCNLCLQKTAKYVCPRCNVSYCSLACYKSLRHADCSESFYREHVIDEMKNTKKSSEERQQVLDMLKRLEEDDQQYDMNSDEESLETRLEGLNLEKDSDLVWEKLTHEEREGFEKLLKNEKFGGLLEIWIPWWSHHDKSLVKEVKGSSDKNHQITSAPDDVPKILPNITPFNQLLKSGTPSPSISFNCLNILYCYVHIVRFYNGQHYDLPLQSAQGVFQVCDVFRVNKSYQTVGDAIHSAIAANIKITALRSNLPPSSLVEDLLHLLTGPDKEHDTTYIQAAFSDLHQLFYKARKCCKKAIKHSGKSSHQSQELGKHYFQCQKKLEFYLSWLMQHYKQLVALRTLVHVEHCNIQSEEKKQNDVKNKIEDNIEKIRKPATTQKLIEEI
ncbi:zinc finger HIT domain-containing protein 2-like [Antedon mediterranea]|uniref:zinc finger HIT domain-containing protein 2-like n=1 Tax=Antedon mediterranea TaxID=105859 RepID=UPI003AF46BAB